MDEQAIKAVEELQRNVNELVSQNKTLMARNEQLEYEVQFYKKRLENQTTYIMNLKEQIKALSLT